MAMKRTDSTKVGSIPYKQSSYNESYLLLWIMRTILLITCIAMCAYKHKIQIQINHMWDRLLSSSIYNSVYFETLFTTTCYGIIIAMYPFVLHYIKYFDKYKVDPSVTYTHQTVLGIFRKSITYMMPFAALDTIVVKKYIGVNTEIWDQKSQDWIQTTRALPENAPSLFDLIFHLALSIVLFDLIFFFVHFTLHRNVWLYKTVHRYHHDHDVFHPHVTDQLTVVERIILVLSANFALKCFNSHPLTRTLFIPVFVFLLVENHTGYDLPFGIHRIVPFGILPGPVKHYNHHVHGDRNYQPFLNYMDNLLNKSKKQLL